MNRKTDFKIFLLLGWMFLSVPIFTQSFGSWGFGYFHNNFSNHGFYQNKEAKNIKRIIGFAVPISYRWNFFSIEGRYFFAGFDFGTGVTSIPEDVYAFNHGTELGFNINVFPRNTRFSPYVGLAGQYSVLSISKSQEDEDFPSSSINTSGAIWKAGLRIRLSDRVLLGAEYGQSMPDSVDGEFDKIIPKEINFVRKPDALQHWSINLLFLFKNSDLY